LTDFWQRLDETFGPAYAASIADDQTIARLGGRTIRQALSAGEDAAVVWRAVVETYPERVPQRLH
jgi:hypothetical protein